MVTGLTETEGMTVEGYAEISRSCLEQARQHLTEGDLSQAAEKIWEAAEQGLKAVGEQRGWVHNNISNVFCVGEHLGLEFGRKQEFLGYLAFASFMRGGYYGGEWMGDTVGFALEEIEELVRELEVIRNSPPRPYTVRNNSDQLRLGDLLGLRREERPAIGDFSPVGFSKTHGVD